MSTYEPAGIGALIYRNGKWGPGGNKDAIIAFLDTAIAICLAESKGNDQAISGKNTDGSTDYGLWQINDKAHADLFKKYTWNNPGDNTEMARQVWANAGNSFGPWSTFKNGAYKQYTGHGADVYATLQKGVAGPNSAVGELLNPATYVSGVGGTVKQAVKDASSVGNLSKNILDSVFTFIKQSALVVGVAILSFLLLAAGIRLLLQQSATYRKAEGHAMDAAKLAAVV